MLWLFTIVSLSSLILSLVEAPVATPWKTRRTRPPHENDICLNTCTSHGRVIRCEPTSYCDPYCNCDEQIWGDDEKLYRNICLFKKAMCNDPKLRLCYSVPRTVCKPFDRKRCPPPTTTTTTTMKPTTTSMKPTTTSMKPTTTSMTPTITTMTPTITTMTPTITTMKPKTTTTKPKTTTAQPSTEEPSTTTTKPTRPNETPGPFEPPPRLSTTRRPANEPATTKTISPESSTSTTQRPDSMFTQTPSDPPVVPIPWNDDQLEDSN